jgi:hypothetical protein
MQTHGLASVVFQATEQQIISRNIRPQMSHLEGL